MSKRLAAATLGFCLAAAFVTRAEARVESTVRDRDTGSITSRSLDFNSTRYGSKSEVPESAAPARQSRVRATRRSARSYAPPRKAGVVLTAAATDTVKTDGTASTSAVAPDRPVTDRAVTTDHPGLGDGTAAGLSAAANDDPEAPRNCLAYEAKILLARIEEVFGPVSMVSTCRPGAVIAGSGKPSLHRYGRAIDFDAGNRKGAIVNWLIEHHKTGGTMTYRSMSHIHVDIGPHFVSLGSGGRSRVASRARKARYARN